ncbi:NAD(+)/NADH kinase [Actinomadura barringtoniae]|uniref:NAD(+)/NADH kinase n=1 Tax=Actinomadura barringtoniae TaxID=1427535 RepID=A0A939T5N2_9ACTN|nr:NAD(+)/NADH kinase [Actinomadura barringtoniae]MBO2450833.1 NAD(+)/NADH kinase [Actinomadura barringtoniae]
MRLGLVVNPVAGLGGRVGLKGSDGEAVQARALALGARPRASERAALALTELRSRLPGDIPPILTAGGPMGADAVRAAGLVPEVVYKPQSRTTPDDTAAAAKALAPLVDLLVFAGGDGTARDLLDAVGTSVPVLGVPTGVKMHSAVFGVSPRLAAEAVAVMAARRARLIDAEVMDLDEEAVREGRVTARLYGHLRVPDVPVRIQQRKTGSSAPNPAAIGGIAAEVASRLPAGDLLVLGPGGTTRAVAAALGAAVPVMGVNALRASTGVTTGLSAVATDLSADGLAELVRSAPSWIAVTPIGGQGFLLGRGNQQISPDVLRAAGPDRLLVVATEAKLAALGGRPLLVDTGDDALDRELAGHRPVITGRGRSTMYPIH